MAEPVVRKLRPFVSERRAALIEQVLECRLRGVAVLLEGLYDHGNLAAVMRTCEALGVHQVHWVDLPEVYKPAKKVGQGAQKWLELREHADVEAAARFFHERGFRLVAGDLNAEQSLDQLDVSSPVVLVFANEHAGVTPRLRELCDETYKIPMVGFSQSLNISCAAAISLESVAKRYRAAIGARGDLTEADKAVIREVFYRRSVRASELIVG